MNVKKILKIAVTGGAASGKSSVCRYLGSKGYSVISLDAVSRELMMPGMPAYMKIVRHFGESYVLKDSSLDRQALRNLITRNSDAKIELEAMVQPEIMKVMFERISDCEKKNESSVIVEVPLLFENNLEGEFDLSVLVTVPCDIQLKRLRERDGVSIDEAERLIHIQMPQEEKMKRADIIIQNSGSHEDLYMATDIALKKGFEKKNLISKALDS